jgi:hypothetical protein
MHYTRIVQIVKLEPVCTFCHPQLTSFYLDLVKGQGPCDMITRAHGDNFLVWQVVLSDDLNH